MRIQEGGNEHIVGDHNCPGCESPEGQQFPQPHRDIATPCPGLIHAEIFGELKATAGAAVIYRRDVCGESM